MKNLESIFAAYAVFWAIVFLFQLSVARRLSRAEEEVEKLKQQLHR
jgi:CcmD family protein